MRACLCSTNHGAFDKAEIYRVISRSSASGYLPETYLALNQGAFREMLSRHSSIYLKPRGGSIGQGMVRIDARADGYDISVLKDHETKVYQATNLEAAWSSVNQHRMPGGQYLIQAAKPLLKWQGRPCDFRTLLQKYGAHWRVVGIGVRVAGEGVITTHVPNGGSIVAANEVLQSSFKSRAGDVERELRRAVLQSADAIDLYYDRKLGEMSMDMAIEDTGRVWFLEANSKPMKFDEKSIRKESLEGVILHLEELQQDKRAVQKAALTRPDSHQ
ncbi:YheC/YheD family protein [Alicyclobacillus sp. SO9]|uniref:YheC/YheD family protein n=1 Tax=Alicyclobacillus sp. SO9 TaxID=2665646 RepID=UPI0018E774E8|nr:YheC/YheD family protein [Alicyclobacillus sp. SO9]QQE80963.1 YheC/YheD family protein [Alicyclobacillus sp. SO9]